MNTYTIATTDDQDLGLLHVVEKINAARPRNGNGDFIGSEVTPSEYLQARIQDVLNSYVAQMHADEGERLKTEYLAQAQGGSGPSELLTAKQAKLAEFHGTYTTAINAGITPTGTDITLAAEQNDQAEFTKLITLLREVEEMQPTDNAKAAVRNSTTTIVDKDSVPHEVTVQQLRLMIVDYGNQLKTLWGTYATKRAQVNAAKTVEEVEAIS